MANGFTYAGHSTGDFNMYVERYPDQPGAARRMTEISIPGRHGALHIDDGTFEPVLMSYECYFHGPVPSPEQASRIRAWLQADGSPQILSDVYHPDIFRRATYAGPFDAANFSNKFGRVTVSFSCDPRQFLLSGDTAQEIHGSGTIVNPTAFASAPLIRIYGTAPGTVQINSYTVEVLDISDYIVVDCEMQDAYRLNVENKNSVIRCKPFPQLTPGVNRISVTGGITSLTITPRWWTL